MKNDVGGGAHCRARICKTFSEPRNRFQRIDSDSLCSLSPNICKHLRRSPGIDSRAPETFINSGFGGPVYDSPGINSLEPISGHFKILQIQAQDFITIPGAAQVSSSTRGIEVPGGFNVWAQSQGVL